MFVSASFQGGKWAGEGPVVTFVEQDGEVAHLIRYDLETEQRELLVDGVKLYAPDVERTVGIDEYAYSPDGSAMLIYTDSEQVWRYNTKGYYYLYDLATQRLTPIARREDGFQMFAKFSPDGRRVAFVRNRDLFVVDLADMSERRLTDDGGPGKIINGTSDWVYEEEFGLRDGWAWSPDGAWIAYVQLDESNTREFAMADLRAQYPDIARFRYPKAGEANSEIRVGVVDVVSGSRQFFDTGDMADRGRRPGVYPEPRLDSRGGWHVLCMVFPPQPGAESGGCALWFSGGYVYPPRASRGKRYVD